MKTKKITSLLSLGVIIGFIIGLIVSIYYTIANQYIQYKMFKLAALSFQKNLNSNIFYFVAGLLALYILWFLLVEKMKCASFLRLLLTKLKWENMSKIIKRTALALFMFLAILNLCIVIDSKINVPQGPDIILVSIDALRADRLGCYGYSRNTSPNIDVFSRNAVLFTNAITPRPKTTPSMASVFTGLYPHTHDVRTLYKPLEMGILTLQEILRNKNYKTAAFVGNWVLKKNYSGLNQGFETYDDRLPDREPYRAIYERKAPDMNRAVFEWLDKNHNNKFFLWIHYQDVHGPYIAPKKYRRLFMCTNEDLISVEVIPKYYRLPWIEQKNGYVDANSYRDAYNAEIRFCDEYIGNLFKKLDDLGLTNVIIVITADHGESLGEHSYYFGHGKYVYDQCSRVPLLVHTPKIKNQKLIKKQVNIMNITPTILDMLGYSPPSDIEGTSLLPLIAGDSFSEHVHIFIERLNDIKAVRTDSWKYIKNFYCDTEELYYLKEDSSETNNLISKYKDIAGDLEEALSQWMNINDGIPIKRLEEMQLKEEQKEALRSLGYLQ